MDKAADILQRVRRIELRAKHLASGEFAGQYQSGFRGQGLDFDDFREYTPGDDPRFIDWKVTARMNTPFVRRFREEREQAVILAVDGSASMHYASATGKAPKLDYAARIAAVIAFSAAQSGDKCGLLVYNGEKSQYVPPAKGLKQTLRIVREIIAAPNNMPDQDMRGLAQQLVLSQKKAAMLILISDFWGQPDRAALGQLNFKHDLIPIRIADPVELQLPDAGRVVLRNAETGETMFFNTSNQAVRDLHAQNAAQHRELWTRDFRALGIDYLDLATTANFMPQLKALFIRRVRKFSR